MAVKNMSLGAKLRSARKRAGYTQRQLADKIGAKHNSVSNWEKGLNRPNTETIGELCAVLNITPNELIIDSQLGDILNIKEEFSPAETAFLRMYRGLDAAARGAVDALLTYYSGLATARFHKTQEPAIQLAFPADPEWEHEILQGRISRQSVAAGTGTYLDEDSFENFSVQKNDITRRAGFYVPVSGDSMEPRYHDGDILIIEDAAVNQGEIGIFTLGGHGYVKKLGARELISLNPDYAPIPMDDSIICNGKVIGVLDPEWRL
jgi:SOS-response transcriptional repressor LexA